MNSIYIVVTYNFNPYTGDDIRIMGIYEFEDNAVRRRNELKDKYEEVMIYVTQFGDCNIELETSALGGI